MVNLIELVVLRVETRENRAIAGSKVGFVLTLFVVA